MRCELKYDCGDLSPAEVLQIVRSHPMSFRKQGADRLLNTIFFDTGELELLRQRLDGDAERLQIRLRWEGADLQPNHSAQLQLKIKRRELVEKRVLDVPIFSALEPAQFITQIRNLLALHDGLSARSFVEFPSVLQMRLLRTEFISYDRKFRLAIDRDVQYYAGNAGHNMRAFSQREGRVVLGLKYDAADADRAQHVTQRLPLRHVRHSYFVRGMEMVGGRG